MITHNRETYQPTIIMRWDRGIFNGSCRTMFVSPPYPGDNSGLPEWDEGTTIFGAANPLLVLTFMIHNESEEHLPSGY